MLLFSNLHCNPGSARDKNCIFCIFFLSFCLHLFYLKLETGLEKTQFNQFQKKAT